MLPDEDGAYFCETVGLRIGLEEGRVWLEDANTAQELLTNRQVRVALDAEAAARKAAEARAAALAAQLAALPRKAYHALWWCGTLAKMHTTILSSPAHNDDGQQ